MERTFRSVTAMHVTGEMMREAIPWILGVAAAGVLFVWALQRSDEPKKFALKWLTTLAVLAAMAALIRYLRHVSEGGLNYATACVAAFFGVIATAVLGLVLAIIWRQNLAALLAKPLAGLYDGGGQQLEAQPLYSMAKARRNRGKYSEAIQEIRRQLERFPKDFEGQLLLAEIQAENLNDVSGAEVTLQRLCRQSGHTPGQIALALNCLADWHLKFGQDRDAARLALEQIIELLPDSVPASRAAQRIAHLADTAHLVAAHDPKRIPLRPGVADMGLLPAAQQPKAPEADPEKLAAGYVAHLEAHPMDTEAREELAKLYADHYQRLDLATEQLEQLIAFPNQPGRNVAHWLNLLADLQVRHSGDYETVRQTVQRIIDLFPHTAAAQTARNRLDHLRLEFKGKQKSQTIRLGSYEQDIGLKKE